MNKRTFRVILAGAIAAAISLPLIAQTQNNAAAPDTPSAAASKPATQPAVDPNKVVITIGDTKITAGEFNSFLSDLEPAQQQQVNTRPDGRRRLAEEIVKLKLLSAEARKRKLDETPRTKIIYEQLLANALTTDLAEQKADLEKFFNAHKEDFDELKARHILLAVVGGGVPNAKLDDAQAKAKAEELKKRLDKGEDFAALAKANSDDTGSGAMGGSLGNVTRGMMVPEFEKAAFSLKKNEISQPVKTQFGYHIIQVTDRTPVTFEQARQQILQRRLDDLVDQLKATAKPELDDSFFGGAKAQAAADPKQAQTASAKVNRTK